MLDDYQRSWSDPGRPVSPYYHRPMTQLAGPVEPSLDGPTPPQATESGRLRRPDIPLRRWAVAGVALWRPLAILIAARVAMGLAMFVYSHVTHEYHINPWDGGWYVYAAQHGWPHHVQPGTGNEAQDTLAFFPGLPTVIRVVHFLVPISWERAGEAGAFLTQVAMVAGFWLLTREIWGRTVADRAVVAMCFFPGAFILAIMYSEPLLIACGAFCMLALRRERWILAGLFAAAGTATRVVGVALVACCAWESYRAIRRERRWTSLVAVALAPTGIVAWFLYLWASTGARLAWLDTERNGWAQHSTLMAIPRLITSVLHKHPADPNDVLALASTVLGLVLLVALIVSRAPSVLTVYSVVVLAISATSVNPSGIRFRFVMTAFPLVMVIGRYLKDAAFSAAIAASAVVMSAMLVVTLTGYSLIP